VWTDPDLGCAVDDYIGCDTSRSLAICYNKDNIDGSNGAECDQGTPTYGDKIPIVGIDYFRGPRDSDKPILDSITCDTLKDPFTGAFEFEEIGMNSFTYHIGGSANAAMNDPQTDQEFYNYMIGKWRDGTPFTKGGNGYNPGSSDVTPYAFPGQPADLSSWTMCNENLDGFDGRVVQASGPFRLAPGAVNELIIGVPWVPDQDYPCPSFEELFEADDISQALFDNCFDITDGPDAPCLSFVELDREVVMAFSNDPTSNNYELGYTELDLSAPPGQPNADYKFEGYIVYQLRDPSVGRASFTDPELARIVYQTDVKNGVSTVYNWEGVKVSQDVIAYVPEMMVQGADKGIRNTFNITDDQFAQGDQRRLINHRKYYYVAIAYAYNNWEAFDPSAGTGQKKPFLKGNRNIGDGEAEYYTVVPRPINDRVMNASFGTDGVVVTRWEGVGTDKNFLDVADETRDSWLTPGAFDGKITYLSGKGPISVHIFNPLDVKNGEFELTFVDDNMSDDLVAAEARWKLTELATGAVVISAATIESLNEQLLAQYGFSVSIAHGVEPGSDPFNEPTNGFIGATATYLENKADWFGTFTDGPNFVHFNQTLQNEPLFSADPNRVYAAESNKFVPYQLCGWKPIANQEMVYSPAWINNNNDAVNDGAAGLKNLNNVDIVLTRDKSKWSRCVVVETSNQYIIESESLSAIGDANNFDLRRSPSVGKEDADGDGIPDLDGALETIAPLAGQPMEGMGWFPGYAVDVETGQRLNIFFGEASIYGIHNFSGLEDDPIYAALLENQEGIDMMWNPTSKLQFGVSSSLFDFFAGGHQYVYVTDEPYDGCDFIRSRLDPKFGATPFRKISALKRITWTAVPNIDFGQRMLSYAQGLIPNEMIIKMRVENSYKHMETASSVHNGYPTYRIKLDGVEASPLTAAGIETQLDKIGVVPNPYYGYSAYEITQFSNVVKITNLPPKCKITIYSLDGKFIRQYDRNEAADNAACLEPAIGSQQVFPDLDWDLRNSQAIPVSSGVYLIHVDAPGLGERVIKWFGTNRKFDPSGL
jgi:hypothetical protein